MLETTVEPTSDAGPDQLYLSEVISSLSYALDITEGQPEGHAVRSCLIGMRIADVLGLSEEEKSALYYALLLKDLGCSSNAAKMCWLFKEDDRTVGLGVKYIDWQNNLANGWFALRHAMPGAGWLAKIKAVFNVAKRGPEEGRELVKVRCERGADITRMLGFPEATAQAILGLDEHWNGDGHPLGLKGEEIPLLGRICCLAQTVEVFATQDGMSEALGVAQSRSGTWFDPELVVALRTLRRDKEFWQLLKRKDLASEVASIEPQQHVRMVDNDLLDRVCLAFSQVVDAKSPWTFRHSEGVARISVGIAEHLGLSFDEQRDIRRAGLLHDIGKLGVSNLVLDKPGKLTDDEYDQMKTHTIYTQSILERVSCFRRFANYASAHHERIDGRGYHRGLSGDALPLEARILAVADVTEALAAKRPYRDGMPAERIVGILREDAGTAFDHDCVEALVQFAESDALFEQLAKQNESVCGLPDH